MKMFRPMCCFQMISKPPVVKVLERFRVVPQNRNGGLPRCCASLFLWACEALLMPTSHHFPPASISRASFLRSKIGDGCHPLPSSDLLRVYHLSYILAQKTLNIKYKKSFKKKKKTTHAHTLTHKCHLPPSSTKTQMLPYRSAPADGGGTYAFELHK